MNLAKLRNDIKKIYNYSINAINPYIAIKNFIEVESDKFIINNAKTLNLKDFKSINIVGIGKAAFPMAKACEEILGSYISTSIITVKYGYSNKLSNTIVQEAGHPIPDENSVKSTQNIINILNKLTKDDLLICLISGGTSSLLVSLQKPITLKEMQEATKTLLSCGANIKEINALRKHISTVKGGNLAKIAYPAKILSFILSDVIGNPLDAIGSGPLVPDNSTFTEVKQIIDKYNIEKNLPQTIVKHIYKGLKKEACETPKQGNKIFDGVENYIIGSNITALKAAEEKAKNLGYNTLILSSLIEGEAKECAIFHSAIAKEIKITGNPIKPPACIISGGENTVTIKGNGKGGRNMEFVLATIPYIANNQNIVITSIGTDGTDGPTDSAGAIADNNSAQKSIEAGLDYKKYLNNNDSYNFFGKMNDLIKTGPTNTNVMDLRIMLVS